MAIQQKVFENLIIFTIHRFSKEIHGAVTTGRSNEFQEIVESG